MCLCVCIFYRYISFADLSILQSPGHDNRRIIQPLSRTLPSMSGAYTAVITKHMIYKCTMKSTIKINSFMQYFYYTAQQKCSVLHG